MALHQKFGELTRRCVQVRKGPLRRYVAERKAHRNCPKGAVRMLWIQRIVETLDMLPASDFDLVVDPRSLRNPKDDVPQRGLSHSPHRQPGRQAENSLGEV